MCAGSRFLLVCKTFTHVCVSFRFSTSFLSLMDNLREKHVVGAYTKGKAAATTLLTLRSRLLFSHSSTLPSSKYF